jgi:hypothetical protein
MYIFRQQRSFGIANKLAMYEKRSIGIRKRARTPSVKKLNPFDKSIKDLIDLNERERYMNPYDYKIEKDRLIRNQISEFNKWKTIDNQIKNNFGH